MCQFISWVEGDKKNYFITGEQLFNTIRGKALQKKFDREDWLGHSAIRYYYRLRYVGEDREQTDFSSPNNFPTEIAEAIKQGKFRGIAVVAQLLSQPALAEYEKIKQPALAEYRKIEQPALAEYEKIKQQALAKYRKIKQQALAEYRKIEQPALAEYEKIKQQAFWDLFKKSENRNPAWR